jgi:hypothetical protein
MAPVIQRSLGLALLAALLIASKASPASETSGAGNHFPQAATKRISWLEPLGKLGADAIRVTVDHRGNGRVAWTVTLYPEGPNPKASGRLRAVGDAIAYDSVVVYRRAAHPIYVANYERLVLWQTEYDELAARIDSALARRDPWPPSDFIAVVGCGQPRYVIERRKNGRTTWLSQECADNQAGAEVIDMLIERFPFPLCWYVADAQFRRPCEEVRAPGVQEPRNVEPELTHGKLKQSH